MLGGMGSPEHYCLEGLIAWGSWMACREALGAWRACRGALGVGGLGTWWHAGQLEGLGSLDGLQGGQGTWCHLGAQAKCTPVCTQIIQQKVGIPPQFLPVSHPQKGDSDQKSVSVSHPPEEHTKHYKTPVLLLYLQEHTINFLVFCMCCKKPL